MNEKEKKITVNMDGIAATVDTLEFVSFQFNNFEYGETNALALIQAVDSDNEAFKKRVSDIVDRVKMAMKPISNLHECFA